MLTEKQNGETDNKCEIRTVVAEVRRNIPIYLAFWLSTEAIA